MTSLTSNLPSMDELTKAVTAFFTWEEFRTAMINGYIPTLRPIEGRSKACRTHNEQVQLMVKRLKDLGYRVFEGCGK
jgi:hypothetical protein